MGMQKIPTSNNLFYNMFYANVTANVCGRSTVKKRKIVLTIILHSLNNFCFCCVNNSSILLIYCHLES